MKKIQKAIVLMAAIALVAMFVAAVFSPSRSVSATPVRQQDIKDCAVCHEQAVNLWEGSHHKEGNVSCLVCHKLADTGKKHPEGAKYTVESEDTTCLVCHTDVVGENIAGQLALSQHGKVGLTCVSCHEQHSQGLKLAEGSRTVCENCHKKEMKAILESTHFQAGLSCVNCHMGKDKNHTLIVAMQTCNECHTDLHDARRMVDAGLEIKPMTTPEALIDAQSEPTPAPTAAPVTGGIHMPSWTLVFAGMLIGGVVTFALVGKEPGKPSETIEESETSKSESSKHE